MVEQVFKNGGAGFQEWWNSLENLDIDTIDFIISTLNFINMDKLRNKIILEILPLKV